LQTKQNNKIQLISSAQNSLKTVPTLPRFPCPLEAENMYCTDTTVLYDYGLYGFCFVRTVRIFFFFFFQKLLSNGVQLTTFNVVRTVPSVVFYALISMPTLPRNHSFSLLQQISPSELFSSSQPPFSNLLMKNECSLSFLFPLLFP
jgi:hypothetical protein